MLMARSLVAPAGIPGNDDQAAMATLLTWHLLGLYPGVSNILDTLAAVDTSNVDSITGSAFLHSDPRAFSVHP